MQMPVIFPLCDCCSRLRQRSNFLLINAVPTLLYSALAVSDHLPLAANKNISDFAAALTRAVVTEDTLELANGMCFLGKRALGSKLFIRPCYKEMADLILSGEMQNFVVTGTPGIGKSMFGYYLLYLLRCEGKNVVFELKGDWYRFGNEGAQEGTYQEFRRAGFTRDPTAWYLSDPEGSPRENFEGTTTVLVSPDYERIKEFLKLPTSKRIFMPVWSLEELLKCRRVVFSHVLDTDVVKSFGVVGGVARAAFNEEKFELLKDGILNAVGEVDVGLLRQAARLSSVQNRIQTNKIGDKLFHILSNSADNFKGYTVTFASNYTRDSIALGAAERGRDELLAFVGESIRNPDVSRMLGGGSTVGNMFEQAAHLEISGRRTAGAPFNMAILNATRGGFLSGESKIWNLSFNEVQVFKGNGSAFKYDSEIYYRPYSTGFPGIDSFALDSRDDTLYFFQMKYTGAEPIKQGSKVQSFWDAAVASEGVSVKNCVLVFVVPEGTAFEKSKVLSKCWLPGASTDFLSACGVCVVAIRCLPL
ncbi:unnamed protein product [Pylaiella littoralis]